MSSSSVSEASDSASVEELSATVSSHSELVLRSGEAEEVDVKLELGGTSSEDAEGKDREAGRPNDIEELRESLSDGRSGEGGGVCKDDEDGKTGKGELEEVASSAEVTVSSLTVSNGGSSTRSIKRGSSTTPSTSPMKYPCTMVTASWALSSGKQPDSS